MFFHVFLLPYLLWLLISLLRLHNVHACLSVQDHLAHLQRQSTRPFDCADIQLANPASVNGFFTVSRPGCVTLLHSTTNNCTKRVLCDFTTNGGGWTVIQQRRNGAVDFFDSHGWTDYRNGFGTTTEFWLGNNCINELTNQVGIPYQLLVEVTDENGIAYTSMYSSFIIDSEANFYRPTLGTYTGTLQVDNFVRIQNQPFGTLDRDNDQNPNLNCATLAEAGWWYNPQCEIVGNLNVPYTPSVTQPQLQGIVWQSDNGFVRLLQTSMKIRPANFTAAVGRKRRLSI